MIPELNLNNLTGAQLQDTDRAALEAVLTLRGATADRLSLSELEALWATYKDTARIAWGIPAAGQVESAIGDYRRACEGGDSSAVERTRAALLHRLDLVVNAAARR